MGEFFFRLKAISEKRKVVNEGDDNTLSNYME